MQTIELSKSEADELLAKNESHFLDFKSKRIAPAKLSRTLSAFGNAEGGEVLIGIEDASALRDRWDGFVVDEEANDAIAVLTNLFPEGESFSYRFLRCADYPGLILSCEIFKNQHVWKDTQGDAYLRKGAQSLRQDTFEKQERLRLNKGISSYEDAKVETSAAELAASSAFSNFMLAVVPQSQPDVWLQKQKVVKDGFATVAGVVLFDDEP